MPVKAAIHDILLYTIAGRKFCDTFAHAILGHSVVLGGACRIIMVYTILFVETKLQIMRSCANQNSKYLLQSYRM